MRRILAISVAAMLTACAAETPRSVPSSEATSAALATSGSECYPNPCQRGVRDEGICSCSSIEPACATVYGEAYETTCPALLTWAAACIGGAK